MLQGAIFGPCLNIVYISELGDGWALVFLETKEEYEFVLEAQRWLPAGHGLFMIGGSTPTVPSDVSEAITYSQYSTKETGYSGFLFF